MLLSRPAVFMKLKHVFNERPKHILGLGGGEIELLFRSLGFSLQEMGSRQSSMLNLTRCFSSLAAASADRVSTRVMIFQRRRRCLIARVEALVARTVELSAAQAEAKPSVLPIMRCWFSASVIFVVSLGLL